MSEPGPVTLAKSEAHLRKSVECEDWCELTYIEAQSVLNELSRLRAEVEALRAERDRYRSALEWIVNYGGNDLGCISVAKRALEGK